VNLAVAVAVNAGELAAPAPPRARRTESVARRVHHGGQLLRQPARLGDHRRAV